MYVDIFNQKKMVHWKSGLEVLRKSKVAIYTPRYAYAVSSRDKTFKTVNNKILF